MLRSEIRRLSMRNTFLRWKLKTEKSRSESLERVKELLAVETTRRENAERALSYYRACEGGEGGKVRSS